MEEGLISTDRVPILKFSDVEYARIEDSITIEEPLEIFVNDEQFYTTMRMPGDEVSLALGICFTDSIIDSMEDVAGVNYCGNNSSNKINVYLKPLLKNKENLMQKKRCSTTHTSCGICGKDMIDDMTSLVGKIDYKVIMDVSDISGMQKVMQKNQVIFPVTGGTHAAGIFSAEADLLSFAEDVGRHNALDKAIGMLLLSQSINRAAIVVLTSRLSFEMVHKAVRLGAEIVCGVSSPTSLAVELAKAANVTLIGFMRGKRGNIYACPERIAINNVRL